MFSLWVERAVAICESLWGEDIVMQRTVGGGTKVSLEGML